MNLSHGVALSREMIWKLTLEPDLVLLCEFIATVNRAK